ncbi:MAG TPA: hypothetical protein VL551_21365 [Actinospica sp.]|jgi:serine/threonine-protein kinase RsbW|nr:hypothetical protein [Actinospica sp.]
MKEARDLVRGAGPAPSGGEPFRMAVLAVPADRDYLALARLAAIEVADLLGLRVDRITDLRLAVDEACSLLLSAAADVPGMAAGDAARGLELRFERCPDHLRVTVRGPRPRARPEPDDLGWLILQALVGGVHMDTSGEVATLTLTEPLPAALSEAAAGDRPMNTRRPPARSARESLRRLFR